VLVQEAAAGRLPDWAVAGKRRRAHMHRVAELMGGWARSAGRSEEEVLRWQAAAHLHDVLRGERPEVLRPRVTSKLQDLPGPLLHGPAAARRLEAEGVEDEELLLAVAYHTLGHPGLRRLGRSLYAADFLEPGRDLRNAWRAGLRDRMPEDTEDVVRGVAAARLTHRLEAGGALRRESVAFWNALVEES